MRSEHFGWRLRPGAAGLAALLLAATACTAREKKAPTGTKPDESPASSDPSEPSPPPSWALPKDTASRPEDKPGRGIPDETNGVCRLYAPRLPEPMCCRREYGFDAVVAAQTCGLGPYLGESIYGSCGYHYKSKDGGPETWFRMSAVRGDTVDEAIADHDLVIQKRLRVEGFKSKPIPGVPGGFWSGHEELNWAFLPGWDVVRQVAWHDTACSDDDMAKLLKIIAAAKPPPPKAERIGLFPVARK